MKDTSYITFTLPTNTSKLPLRQNEEIIVVVVVVFCFFVVLFLPNQMYRITLEIKKAVSLNS